RPPRRRVRGDARRAVRDRVRSSSGAGPGAKADRAGTTVSRPAVSVVMPFAGDREQGLAALTALRALATGAGDELILSDNSGVMQGGAAGIDVVRASGEASAAHARNVGAAHATRDWILFLDADCEPAPDLLDAYFST